MTGKAGAVGPVSYDLRDTEAWLVSGIRGMGAIVDGDERRTLRKIKALVELLYWETYVLAKPSPAILRALRAKLVGNTEQLLLFFWHHLETDTLARVCLGMMVDLGLIGRDHSVLKAVLYELSQTYHEQLPFRALDAAHANWKFWERSPSRPTFRASSDFKGNLPPRTLADEYALTHTIFYLTDFGQNPEALTTRAPTLERQLRLLVAEAWVCRNLDILAEHLLCLRFIGRDQSADSGWYSHELMCQRIDNRYWQGPLQLKRKLLSEGFEHGQLQFFENYHTTLLVRDVLLGRAQRNLSSRTAISRPARSTYTPPIHRKLGTLDNLLHLQPFSATTFCQELTDPESIQLNLMALSRWARLRGSNREALSVKLMSVIDALADLRQEPKRFSLALNVALAQDLRAKFSDQTSSAEDAYGPEQLEKSLRKLLSGPLTGPGAERAYGSKTEVVCIAVLKLDSGRTPLFWSAALRGLLHRAVRQRDLVNMTYLLWAADTTGLAIDGDTAALALNLINFYLSQPPESTLLLKAARTGQILLAGVHR